VTRTLRVQLERTKRSPQGTHALGFGIRLGYWPCLRAPYVQFAFAIWRLDVWHGLPSYRGSEGRRFSA
jgi:hypothetical protein